MFVANMIENKKFAMVTDSVSTEITFSDVTLIVKVPADNILKLLKVAIPLTVFSVVTPLRIPLPLRYIVIVLFAWVYR